MNYAKYLLCIFIIFLPFKTFSQHLEPRDIDIFIIGYEEFNSLANPVDEWGEIKYLFSENISLLLEITFMLYPFEDTDDRDFDICLNELKNAYDELINFRVPDELVKGFELIGWTNNGYKKYMTIMFGTACLLGTNDITNISEERYLRILEIFNKRDLDIIDERIEEIEGVVNK
jgi:hypothetical protein